MHLNRIYILSHKHSFEDGHKEGKLIGAFFSKKKALAILEKYKKKEGFRDNLEGFCIQEIDINKLDDKHLKTIIKEQKYENN